MIGRDDKNGPQGSGIGEDVCFILNTVDRHAVAFSPVAATLSAADGPKGPHSQQLANPEANFVCETVYGLDRASFNQGKNAKYDFAVEEEVEPTIVARGPGAVGHPVYCAGKANHFLYATKEQAATLVASDWKEPPLVNAQYIVRWLTPTECARLQGFPDWWCADLGTEEPTEEDMAFWREVFETHRKLVSKSTKPKTDKQIAKWLKDPRSDSAEYKMWGNGVALPCVCRVLKGIVKMEGEQRNGDNGQTGH